MTSGNTSETATADSWNDSLPPSKMASAKRPTICNPNPSVLEQLNSRHRNPNVRYTNLLGNAAPLSNTLPAEIYANP